MGLRFVKVYRRAAMRRGVLGTAMLAAAMLAAATMPAALRPSRAQERDAGALDDAYAAEIQPLLARYCHDCHSGDLIEGQIDLGSFTTMAEVRKRPGAWQKVGQMLDRGQMPPEDAAQPSKAELETLRQWVGEHLAAEAREHDGDPGRVVLRRLNNAEYTYTIRDLTAVDTLSPAREFPVDGAAGEGFTNTGSALVMSPALVTKYFDAAKEVAGHAVLLPDGIRFSPHRTRRDWTDDAVERIKQFYARFVDAEGRVDLRTYLAALLEEREALAAGKTSIGQIAAARGLNAPYLGRLAGGLSDGEPSLLLDRLRAQWRDAKPADAAMLAESIGEWQRALWTFQSVGHMKNWQEGVDPVAVRQELRVPVQLPQAAGNENEVTLYLVAGDAGDGNEGDFVVWERPRLVAPGRGDLLLADVREVAAELAARREVVFATAARCLAAAAEAAAADTMVDPAELAAKHDVDDRVLRAWLDYLGIGTSGPVEIRGHFSSQLSSAGGYDFIQGWGSHQTPLLLANSSDKHVRVPGNMRPHGLAVHPSPALEAVVGWQSPVAASVRIEGQVRHAHPECGNGVTWSLELRRGATRRRLATGVAQGDAPVAVGPIEELAVLAGDVVSLSIGPRDGNHACDLTAVDLKLIAGEQAWDLAGDVSGNVLAGNPHADSLGNEAVWHFYTEEVSDAAESGPVVPAGSLLAQWRAAAGIEAKRELGEAIQKLLNSGPPAEGESPDAELYRQLASLGGPLLAGARQGPAGGERPEERKSLGKPGDAQQDGRGSVGLDREMFGRHPEGAAAVEAASLCVQAPSVIAVRLPADLAMGCELVASGRVENTNGAGGTVQLAIADAMPAADEAPSAARPIVVSQGAVRERVEKALDDFRELFPAAMCYTRIVPVDEAVTLTLFHREDEHLARLMLDETQRAHLDRLWREMHFIGHDALTIVDAFEQIMEYATQDSDPSKIEPFRKPINERAAAFRQSLLDAQPRHLEALLEFAGRAYRRPLSEAEAVELNALYHALRAEGMEHEEAFRLTLARVLVSPDFLYRIEQPVEGAQQGPVSDWELANRLSYFLWSSLPDRELREAADAGELGHTDRLVGQARRMLRDGRVRRLATEFACQWLQIHDFENLDEKSESHFPAFAELRGAMYEESIRFFTDLFVNDGSVLDILDADHTFLNEELAQHYAIPGVSGAEWRRVEGVKRFSRGGILAQATVLSKQSGASRTSPILRGNWVSEVLLGERLPRPPKDVPPLPDDEAELEGLTMRELVERHTSDPKCAVCHQRIDPYGYALEAFDAIGAHRQKDVGGRTVDTRVTAMDGAQFEGLQGLRDYLLGARREAFVRQFCRKLLGYSLGRAVQLSDEPLLAQMHSALATNDYRFSAAVETIVSSRQFREIRGRERAHEE